MGRRPNPSPKPVLLFAGLSERQWQFLRLRGYDESDAATARALGISPRVVEGWKKRSATFRALYATAVAQPRLFGTGELSWRLPAASLPAVRKKSVPPGFAAAGALLQPAEPDPILGRALRERELRAVDVVSLPPHVDLEVPAQHRRGEPPPREMGPGEQRLAEALGVEHCVVLGHWNGQPSLDAWTKHERAVNVAAEFSLPTRMPHWYPQAVLMTSAGLIAVADGTLAKDVRCPLKARRRCPLVDLRGVNFARCPYWRLALETWLDTEPPSAGQRPVCDRDFAIARLLAYVAAATLHGSSGGWSAGFPVIAVRHDDDRRYWQPRAARWNSLILDPWHRVHVLDVSLVIDAVAEFRAHQMLGASQRADG